MGIPRTVENTKIKGLYIINPNRFEDNRGIFREAFSLSILEKAINREFKPRAWNHSRSLPNVLRGIHAEQTCKLIYPLTGTAFVAVVDLRKDSDTFGSHMTFEISISNPLALFLEEGLGIGFCTIGNEPVDYQYLISKEYDELKPIGVLWNDMDLNIPWPLTDPIVSERDKNNPTFKQLFPERT